MAAVVPNSPETSRRMMCVTPPKSSIEMREELTLAPRKNQGKSLRKVHVEDEDIVKQDFTVSCDRLGRFVFDKELQIVKLYVLESYDEYTPECSYLLLTAIDWTYFYNQIWRNFIMDEKIWYNFQWDGAIPGMRYNASKPPDYISISSCMNKTLHDQNYLMLVNKRRENSETNFLSQSSDETDSDEYDRDWPLPEVNPFECCKKSLYFEQSDVPVLNTVFSTIDELFQSS